MGYYLRTGRRSGVSVPFWLAIPALLLWASVMIVVCLAALVVWVAVAAWHLGHAGWVRWRAPAA
jgi:hypothetical protein